jgi:hypothetical protein
VRKGVHCCTQGAVEADDVNLVLEADGYPMKAPPDLPSQLKLLVESFGVLECRLVHDLGLQKNKRLSGAGISRD